MDEIYYNRIPYHVLFGQLYLYEKTKNFLDNNLMSDILDIINFVSVFKDVVVAGFSH